MSTKAAAMLHPLMSANILVINTFQTSYNIFSKKNLIPIQHFGNIFTFTPTRGLIRNE